MADHKQETREWAGELAKKIGELLSHLGKRPHAGLPPALEGAAAVTQTQLESVAGHAQAHAAELAAK